MFEERPKIEQAVEDLPETEIALLSAQNIISIMVAPIFVGDSWWGFIGFDTNIMNKLDLHSTIELVRYAAKLGLIDVELWTN